MSEQNSSANSTGWTRVKFYVMGFFACMMKGQLGNYAYLIAQAKLESRDMNSALMMETCANPFGMHFPKLRKTTATGFYNVEGEGSLAIYPSLYAAWIDRLYWSEANNCGGFYDTVGKWAIAQKKAGYNGSDGYAAAVVEQYKTVPFIARMLSNETALAKFTHGISPTFKTLIYMALVFGALYLIGWVVWKLYKLCK